MSAERSPLRAAELMLLGFISLLLTVGQQWIAKICVSTRVGHIMLPCRQDNVNDPNGGDGHKRRLLWELSSGGFRRRLLAAGGGKTDCSQPGTVPLISQTGIHQLHIFIFVLAIFHILYSVLTMGLAHAKMKKWKAWESETSSLEYQFSYDPSRFRLTHQTSFVKRHAGLSSKPGMRWIVAFFRQLYGSVSKVDYLTLRHGFVIAHLSPKSNFNFHKYIKRSLEDDFKVVVGISLPLWLLAVTMMLLNVYGWYTLYWLSLAPLVILLMVGSKLELVIMRLAHQIQDSTTVVKGAPIVQPSNELFWFNRPEWILLLIHLTIFENAFQMAYFVWIMCTFKGELCFHAHMVVTVLRVVLGLALQFLCSYSTFPLYALVTQMGSHMKKTIFEEQTAKALDKWRKAAKERKKQRAMGIEIPSGYVSGEATPSRGTSPLHLLHKHTTANAGEADSVVTSPFHNHSDTEVYEMEPTHGVMHLEPEPVRPAMDIRPYKDNASIDFSFSSRY